MPIGENCSSSCQSKDHETWGECVRAKNLKTNALNPEVLSVQKSADKTLAAYRKARKYGIQPKTTQARDVERAVRISDKTGTAYQA